MWKTSLWKKRLSQLLITPDRALPRLVIVGVGQMMRGDDGAGPAVTSNLKEVIPPHNNLLIIDAGHAPENCLGPIIRFQPEIILFIDAVKGHGLPGTVYWLHANEAEAVGGSTHTLSLSLLGEYLRSECGANSYILGIQPSDMAIDAGLSSQVAGAVDQVTTSLAFYWRRATTACSAIILGEPSVVST